MDIQTLHGQIVELQKEVINLKLQVEFLSSNKKEVYYQKQLEKLLGGLHTTTKHGITDISTKDAIYEIKCWNQYKSCLGQLKSYSVGNENKRLYAIFFGDVVQSKIGSILDLFTQNNIEVYKIVESSIGIISLTRLDQLQNQYLHKDVFYKWLDTHLVYKENSVLQLKDTIELFLNKKIHSRQLHIYIIFIEHYIQSHFSNLKFNYSQFWYNNKKYKGWFHLYLTI